MTTIGSGSQARSITCKVVCLIFLVVSSVALTAQKGDHRVRNVVLVHGAWADGSGRKGVYEILTRDGYNVSIVQEPETSFKDDVEATQRVIAQQDGPCILVAHSYGGAVATEAGNVPSVAGLVYVAAHMPDVGESEAEDGKRFPSDLGKSTAIRRTPDGFTSLDPAQFHEYFAADLSIDQAAFMARSQVPNFADNFKAVITAAAWRSKPSWMVVAGGDRTINPDLERWYAKRAGSHTIEVPGASHAVYVSHPKEISAVIEDAALHAQQTANSTSLPTTESLHRGFSLFKRVGDSELLATEVGNQSTDPRTGEKDMTNLNFEKENTALLVIDPYNDFISEGGKLWDRIKNVAEENNTVPHMAEVVATARQAGLRVFYALHRRYRPGDYETWKYIAPIQKAAMQRKTFEYGTWGGEIRPEFAPRPGDIVAEEHWGSSGFANTDLDLLLKRHGIQRLIVIGLIAHTCVEATVRFAAELGYDVTVVKDATADFSNEYMDAALATNLPSYANAIVTTDEIIGSISALDRSKGGAK